MKTIKIFALIFIMLPLAGMAQKYNITGMLIEIVKIHKSFIISLEKIKSIENNRVIIQGKYLPVGDHYKEEFYEYIRRFRL